MHWYSIFRVPSPVASNVGEQGLQPLLPCHRKVFKRQSHAVWPQHMHQIPADMWSMSTLCAVHCKTQIRLCSPARAVVLQTSVASPLDRSSLCCSLAGSWHLAGEHCVLISAISLQQHQHEERNMGRSGVVYRCHQCLTRAVRSLGRAMPTDTTTSAKPTKSVRSRKDTNMTAKFEGGMAGTSYEGHCH